MKRIVFPIIITAFLFNGCAKVNPVLDAASPNEHTDNGISYEVQTGPATDNSSSLEASDSSEDDINVTSSFGNINQPPVDAAEADGHLIWNMPADDREIYLDTFEYVDINRSTAIDRLGYSDYYGDLYVRFLDSQKAYSYTDVSYDVYHELLEAESIGRYYNQHIKGQYDCIRLFD